MFNVLIITNIIFNIFFGLVCGFIVAQFIKNRKKLNSARSNNDNTKTKQK